MQKYPSCRYHASLSMVIVNDEEEDSVLTPESDGWSDVPGGAVSEPVETLEESMTPWLTKASTAPKPEGEESQPAPIETDSVSEGDVASDSKPDTFTFGGEFGDGNGDD